MEDSDQKLIAQCLAGNHEAFATLVTRYQKMVFNMIYQITGGLGEADDLSQEVFLRIYRSLSTYKSEYRFATWIMKITTHVCLDSFRRRRPVLFEPQDSQALPDTRPDPHTQIGEAEQMAHMRRAICELPEEYRVPLVLFHQQGQSYREMEEILNQPESIIKNRLFRARRLLREKMFPETMEKFS